MADSDMIIEYFILHGALKKKGKDGKRKGEKKKKKAKSLEAKKPNCGEIRGKGLQRQKESKGRRQEKRKKAKEKINRTHKL